MIELQRKVAPLVEPMAQISPIAREMGTITELGHQMMENRPAIDAIEKIQLSAEIGMLSESVIRDSGFSTQELTAMNSSPAIIEATSVIRQFDTAIGEILPNQAVLRGFQSSWPAIEAFNRQVA